MSKRRRSMVLRTYMMGVGHLHTCDAPVRPSGTAHEQQGHSGSLRSRLRGANLKAARAPAWAL